MTPKERLKELYSVLKEAKEQNLTPEEILLEVKQIIPPEVIIQEKVSPRREYFQERYKVQKKIKAIREKEEQEKERIRKALDREVFFCYKCKKSFNIQDKSTNTYKLKQKQNQKKKSILILNKCPVCDTKATGFGGYL